MKKILIIGGGFAGISALNKLYSLNRKLDVSLIDRKEEFNFLPVIPDIVGRKINPVFLTNNLKDICREFDFKFIKGEVTNIDLQKRIAYAHDTAISYDYLLISSGTETNFYGNDVAQKISYKLDGVQDAGRIWEVSSSRDYNTIIIAGGGYTGIEIATNLKKHLDSLKTNKRIIIVEKAPSLLGPLPDWMKQYVCENLKKLNIKFLTNTEIAKIESNTIALSNGTRCEKAMLIWTAGVKTCEFIEKLSVEKNRQGRIKVDKYLRIQDNCFVAGDTALFSYKGKDLRMAIQFAIAQGELAAINIIKSIRNKPLKQYKPIDLGYIIPMANNNSCGTVLGFDVRGLMPTILHYFMCIYRTYGYRNKLGLIKDLIKGGKK